MGLLADLCTRTLKDTCRHTETHTCSIMDANFVVCVFSFQDHFAKRQQIAPPSPPSSAPLSSWWRGRHIKRSVKETQKLILNSVWALGILLRCRKRADLRHWHWLNWLLHRSRAHRILRQWPRQWFLTCPWFPFSTYFPSAFAAFPWINFLLVNSSGLLRHSHLERGNPHPSWALPNAIWQKRNAIWGHRL